MEVLHDDTLTPILVYKEKNEIVPYAKIVVPNTMRSPYWKFFGFPADEGNNILTRTKIICCLCRTYIAYNKNTTNLITHLNARHQDIVEQYYTRDESASSDTCVPSKRLKLHENMKSKSSVFGSLKSAYLSNGEHPTGISIKETTSPVTSVNIKMEENSQYHVSVKEEMKDENLYFMNSNEDVESLDEESIEVIRCNEEDFQQGACVTQNSADEDHQVVEFLDEEYLSVNELDHGISARSDCQEEEINSHLVNESSVTELPTSISKNQELNSNFGSKQPYFKLAKRSPKLELKMCVYKSIDLIHDLKQFLISDLIEPNIVEGTGFRQLIQSILKSSQLPNKAEINQSLTADYYSKKTDLDLHIKDLMRSQRFSLYFDKYFPNDESKTESIIIISICYLHSHEQLLKQKTLHFASSISIGYLEELIVCPEWCSAAVFNFSLEDNELKEFFHQKGIPTLESFTSIIEQIIEKCLQLTGIQESIASIEDILRHSITGKSFLQSNKFRIEDYNLLTYFLENYIPESNIEQFFNVIKAVADILQPLKKYLDILSQENIQMASIMMPLAHKLINEDFSDQRIEMVEDNGIKILLRQMTEIAVTDLTDKILNNWFLTVASFLDPRFQNLTDSNGLNKIQMQFEEKISDEGLVQRIDYVGEQVKTNVTNARRSDLSLLFGNRSAINKTSKPKNRFEIEFRSYVEDVNADIDQCPLQWWCETENLYPNIKAHVNRYLCVPCFITGVADEFLKKIDVKLFAQNDIYRKLVWLHYDRFYSG